MENKDELYNITFDQDDNALAQSGEQVNCYGGGIIGPKQDRIEAYGSGIIIFFPDGDEARPAFVGRYDPDEYILIVVNYATGRKCEQRDFIPDTWDRLISTNDNPLLTGRGFDEDFYLIPKTNDVEDHLFAYSLPGGASEALIGSTGKADIVLNSVTCVNRGYNLPDVIACASSTLDIPGGYKKINNTALFKGGKFISLVTEST